MNAPIVHAAPPTVRAVRWTPVAAASAILVGVALLVRASDRPTDLVPAVASAALASLLVGVLQDPAQDVLAPVPVSAMQRRLLRLGLAGVPVLGAWTALTLLAGTSSDLRWTGSLVALAACGVAVAVWAGPRHGIVLGAALPVVWFAVDQAVPAGLASDVVGLWRTDPWPVAAVAVLACLLGRRR